MFQLCSEVNIGSTVDVPEPIFELVWRWSIGTQNVLRFIVGLKSRYFQLPRFYCTRCLVESGIRIDV